MALHHLLILTKHPDDYRARIEAAGLPDLAIVASADVADGVARGAHCDLLLGDPARVKAARSSMVYWFEPTVKASARVK